MAHFFDKQGLMDYLLDAAMEGAEAVSTGIPQLDAILGGGLHVGLNVLAGDPGAGKTALAVQLALFAANKERGSVAYCMSDMGGAKSALLRMVACAAAVAGVDGCELGRASEWDDREIDEGMRAFERVARGRVNLIEKGDIGDVLEAPYNEDEHEWLREREAEMKRHNPSDDELDELYEIQGEVAGLERPKFLVLDFAQAMTYNGSALAFDPEAASLAVRELRAWAHDNIAVVLLLSAYSKSATEAHARGAKPCMVDVLGSAELAYSAEHVLALSNAHDGSGRVAVADLKHRHGGNASQADRECTLHLDAEHGLFS